MTEQELLKYIRDIAGSPYVWWQDGESTQEKMAPFYCKPDANVPTPEQIKTQGMNCAGFINLLAVPMFGSILYNRITSSVA